MRAGPGDALVYSDGCASGGEHCLACSLPECIYEHSREYRKRGLAMSVDNDRLKRMREEKPPCKVPGCDDEPRVYAWNDAERVLDPYCEGHRHYAQDRYYHEWNWL